MGSFFKLIIELWPKGLVDFFNLLYRATAKQLKRRKTNGNFRFSKT